MISPYQYHTLCCHLVLPYESYLTLYFKLPEDVRQPIGAHMIISGVF